MRRRLWRRGCWSPVAVAAVAVARLTSFAHLVGAMEVTPDPMAIRPPVVCSRVREACLVTVAAAAAQADRATSPTEETGATAARDRAAVQRQTSSQPDAVAEVGAAGSKAAVPAVKAAVPILVWATAAVGAEG